MDDKSPEAWSNLGIVLAALERHEAALRAYDRALACNPAYARAWYNQAMTLLEVKRYAGALLACDRAQKLEPDKPEILYTKSRILQALRQIDQAQEMYRKSLDLSFASTPFFIAERSPTHKAGALIIGQHPDLNASLKSFEDLHLYCSNFPGQLFERFREEFHFTYVFVGDAAGRSACSQIPRPDFVINNHVNGEVILSGGNLTGLIDLVDGFGVSVVNHPAKAVQTTRDVSAKLLDHVPGILVPQTMRFSTVGKTCEVVVHEIEDHFAYPLITRTLASQEGRGMLKVDSRAELVAALFSAVPEQFFVTEFVDSRGENKFFRKIRAAIVREEIIVVRVDYDTNWKIYGRKSDERVAFYLANARLLEEERRICQDPEATLGRSVLQSLQAIRDRIPLDAFGVDFDVAADGRLVFYEANATMNLFSTARKEVPYPPAAEDRLRLVFHQFFMSLVADR